MDPNLVAAPSYVGWVVGFCAGLTLLGGAVMGIAAFFVKRHVEALSDNVKLKDAAVTARIHQAETTLKLEITSMRGDFKALAVRVESALAEMERTHKASVDKYEHVTLGMRKVYERAELRFETFQRRLEEIHVIVERWKTLVAKRG